MRALLVIDMQEDFFQEGPLRTARHALSTSINLLVARARRADIPIVWVRQEFRPDLSDAFPGNRIWHAHPVWFLDGNPVVGYSKLKYCIRLLFWSGQSFEEALLKKEGSFKAAEARYTAAVQVDMEALTRWLSKARDIQWDYRNIVRRKGKLERLK